MIPEVVKNLDVESEEGRQLILDGIDMIRSYADKFHHAKEEDILFKYFDEEIQTFSRSCIEDHTHARSLVREMLDALEKRDQKSIAKNLMAYRELLSEHIRKEDEILYPWMDSQLSTHQVGELFSKFGAGRSGRSVCHPDKYENLY